MTDFHLLGDIDIDTGDRHALLANLTHVPAMVERNGKVQKHNTGVYFHHVPMDPFKQWCSVPYEKAEAQGCYKIDVLNNHVYNKVRDEMHLNHLIETQPMWELLQHEEIVKELVHVNAHWELVRRLKPQTVSDLAKLLAMIRPGKRHLVSKCESQGWNSIDHEIWTQDSSGYTFKKSHAISLAMVVVVQLNLLIEGLTEHEHALS